VMEEQQPAHLLVHLKHERPLLIDLDMKIHSTYEGLRSTLSSMLNNDDNYKIIYKSNRRIEDGGADSARRFSSRISNDAEWQKAIQELLESENATLKLHVKVNKQKHHVNRTQTSRSDEKIEKKKQKLQRKVEHLAEIQTISQDEVVLPDGGSLSQVGINKVFVDASNLLLTCHPLRKLAVKGNEKAIVEDLILRLCREICESSNLSLMHVCFDSTLNIHGTTTPQDTFVVSVASAFSNASQMLAEQISNRQIVAGYEESCLVVTSDLGLRKKMQNMEGVKCVSVESWLTYLHSVLGGRETNISKWIKTLVTQ